MGNSWAEVQVINFLFTISSGFGRRNSVELLFLSSSSVIILGCSSMLDIINSSTAARPNVTVNKRKDFKINKHLADKNV